MIDGNAIFDNEGVAFLGNGIVLSRTESGLYYITANDEAMSQDEVYSLGIALARLAHVQFSGNEA